MTTNGNLAITWLLTAKRAFEASPTWFQVMTDSKVIDPVLPTIKELVAILACNIVTDPRTQVPIEMVSSEKSIILAKLERTLRRTG
jgi:hypothetical protein